MAISSLGSLVSVFSSSDRDTLPSYCALDARTVTPGALT